MARGVEPFGPAVDVYALAVVVFEMLTGSNPYLEEQPDLNTVLVRHGSVALPWHRLPEMTVRAGVSHGLEASLAGVAVLVALAGIGAAWLRYGRGAGWRPAKTDGALRQLVANGYYFDAFYEHVIVRGAGWLSAVALGRGVEPLLARQTIDAPARAGNAGARWFPRLQSGDLQAYVVYALIGLALVLGWGALHG